MGVTNEAIGARRFIVRLDSRRRPTLPTKLLDQLGIQAGDSLIASIDDHGGLVLETPQRVKQRLHAAFSRTVGDEEGRHHDPV